MRAHRPPGRTYDPDVKRQSFTQWLDEGMLRLVGWGSSAGTGGFIGTTWLLAQK